jgi:hypothetical protein
MKGLICASLLAAVFFGGYGGTAYGAGKPSSAPSTASKSAKSTTRLSPARSPGPAVSRWSRGNRGSDATLKSTPGASQRPQRSLLAAPGARPSARLTEVIREREHSGPGWLGTAFLISMLSRHDLSDSDRSWLQQRLAEQGSEQEGAPELLAPAAPLIVFNFAGLPKEPVTIGHALDLKVTAKDRHGHPTAVQCTLPSTDAKVANDGDVAAVMWTPSTSGVWILRCAAGNSIERRLLRAVDS